MSTHLPCHIRNTSYQFTLKIGFTLLCLFFLILFCLLGVWQIHRYHFKQTLLFTYQRHWSEAPKPFFTLSNNSIESLQFQPVTVTGHYINMLTMLVQNQSYKNQIGFEVLTPLKILGDNKLLLIDRGWISNKNFMDFPVAEQHISGHIKLLNEYQFILGKNILDKNALPITMQKIDIAEINQITHQTFYPFILQLDEKNPHGFLRHWNMSLIQPERHMAYAVQWFLMAIVLCIAYFYFSCERIEVKDAKK